MPDDRKPEGRRFLLDTLILVGLTQSGAVFHLVFQMIATRAMTKADYAVLAALLNLFLVVYMPCFTLQAVISKFTTEALVREGLAGVRALGGVVARAGLGALLVTLALFAALSVPIGSALHARGPLPVVFVGAFLGLYLASVAWQGILQGLQRFWLLGLAVLSTGLFKCVLGFLVMAPFLAAFAPFFPGRFRAPFAVEGPPWQAPSVEAVSGSLALSAVGVALVAYGFLAATLRGGPPRERPSGILRAMFSYGAPVMLGNAFYALALYGDLPVVQGRFGGEGAAAPLRNAAGLFSYAAIYGKAVIYIPWSFVPVMLPKVTTALARGEDPAPFLWRTLALAASASVAAFGVAIGLPSVLLRYAGGANTLPAAGLLQGYSIAMFFMGLSYVVMNYLLAANRFRFLLPFGILLALEAAGMALLARGPADCIALEIAGSALLLALLLLSLPRRRTGAILPPPCPAP